MRIKQIFNVNPDGVSSRLLNADEFAAMGPDLVNKSHSFQGRLLLPSLAPLLNHTLLQSIKKWSKLDYMPLSNIVFFYSDHKQTGFSLSRNIV
jgi:hypothetical protein